MRDMARLAWLDGLRGVAILWVMVFHYVCRWTPPRYEVSLYPYDGLLAGLPLVDLGLMGVLLFFMVSGYVIAMTLYRCATPFEFAVRRFGRLWPPMLVCSVVTFVGLLLIPVKPFAVEWTSFVPSLTLVEPGIWKVLLGKAWEPVDGVTWSLFVEVKFYLLAGVIFFAQRERFLRNFTVLAGVVAVGHWLVVVVGLGAVRHLLDGALVARYLPWFLMGVGFYHWHRDGGRMALLALVVGALGMVADLAPEGRWVEMGLGFGMMGVFEAVPYVAVVRRGLGASWLAGIGVASYSLYLLHQNLGVALLAWLKVTGVGPTVGVVAMVGIALGMIGVSQVMYRVWEKPVNRWIVRDCIRKG